MQTKLATEPTEPSTGATLRAVRVAQGMSLRATAAAADLDVAHLSRVELGQRHLSVESLYRLSKVLGMTDLEVALRPHVIGVVS